MHGDLSLGGPVWLFATTVVLVTLGLALFVLFDSLRPARRSAVTALREAGNVREPLWLYPAVEAAFLLSLLVPQVMAGVSVASAVPVIAAPIALGFGVAYLLRMVFPRASQGGSDDR